MASTVALAADVEVTEDERYLLNLINQARINPLAMAVMIGKDPEQVVRDFPDKEALLENGIPPVGLSAKIQAAAAAHAEEMITYQNYSTISLDGRTLKQRLAENGYNAALAREVLGMLSFNNFITSDDGVWALFRNMLSDELNPANGDEWVILNPAFMEIGISIGTGRFTFDKRSRNVYLSVCDFATSQTGLYAAEKRMGHLINSVRVNPEAVEAILGRPLSEAAGALGVQNLFKLLFGLPPLAENITLSRAARAQCQKMFDGTLKPDVDGIAYVSDRAGLLGDFKYSAASSGEIRIQMRVDAAAAPANVAFNLIKKLLFTEFKFGNADFIFNGYATEFGTALMVKPVADGEAVYYAVIEFAEPVKRQQYLVGNLFDDAGGNFEPTENIGCRVMLTRLGDDEGTFGDALLAYTGPLGGFQMPIEKGEYQMNIFDNHGVLLFQAQVLHNYTRNLYKAISTSQESGQ